MIIRAESRGKLGQITPGSFAYYALQHCKAGRRALGTNSVDVMAARTQLKGTTRLHSLHEVVSESESGVEIFELQDVISNDREDPATIAARKLDWTAFWISCRTSNSWWWNSYPPERPSGTWRARSGSVIRRCRAIAGRSRRKILEFMGADVLRDLALVPGWRINLDCERETQACRNDRRACAA